MTQRVRIGLLEDGAAVAVDHDGGGRRRVATDMLGRMCVAPLMREMRAAALMAMMPRVRCSSRIAERRTNRGNDHNATAKPVPGPGTCPTHWHPVPDRAQSPLGELSP